MLKAIDSPIKILLPMDGSPQAASAARYVAERLAIGVRTLRTMNQPRRRRDGR
jgi:hypothetical protein